VCNPLSINTRTDVTFGGQYEGVASQKIKFLFHTLIHTVEHSIGRLKVHISMTGAIFMQEDIGSFALQKRGAEKTVRAYHNARPTVTQVSRLRAGTTIARKFEDKAGVSK
jgi:hypothetical protein